MLFARLRLGGAGRQAFEAVNAKLAQVRDSLRDRLRQRLQNLSRLRLLIHREHAHYDTNVPRERNTGGRCWVLGVGCWFFFTSTQNPEPNTPPQFSVAAFNVYLV